MKLMTIEVKYRKRKDDGDILDVLENVKSNLSECFENCPYNIELIFKEE